MSLFGVIIYDLQLNGTLVLALATVFAVFAPKLLERVSRPRLEVSVSNKDHNMVLTEVRNSGRSMARNCYIRISIVKEKKDVSPGFIEDSLVTQRILITKYNAETKIDKDYLVWGAMPNKVFRDIPRGMADIAIIGRPFYGDFKNGVEIPSESAFYPSRVVLKPHLDYDITIYYGSENVPPSAENFVLNTKIYEGETRVDLLPDKSKKRKV